MPKTLPIYYDNCADDLRAAGPSVMLVADFLKYISNSIGFFHVKFDDVCRATGIPLTEIEAVMPVLEKIGFLRYHADSQMVWLLDHAAWNLGHLRANDKKRITQANAEFAAIPKDCVMRVDFLWQHALMLRLEVQGAASPNEASFDSEEGMSSDLLPKFESDKTSREGGAGREI